MRSKFFPDINLPYPSWYVRAADKTIDAQPTTMKRSVAALILYYPPIADIFISTIKKATAKSKVEK